MTLKDLQRIEWAGEYRDGTGSRMGHPEDDTVYACCPLCEGIKGEGHRPKCGLAADIAKAKAKRKP